MTYSFQCPACLKKLEVEADGDDDAVNKIMVAGKEHGEEVHPDMKTDPAEMEKMVRDQMQKS